MKKPIISIYGGHNSCITIYEPYKDHFYTFDLERYMRKKNFRLTDLRAETFELIQEFWQRNDDIYDYVLDYIRYHYQIDNDFLYFIYNSRGDLENAGQHKFKFEKDLSETSYRCLHHEAHALSSYMQSPFNNCFVLSYDGGGDGTSFNVYKIKNGDIVWEEKKIYDFGPLYLLIMGEYPIFKDQTQQKLETAGKAMGLSAYGKKLLPIQKELKSLSRIDASNDLIDTWRNNTLKFFNRADYIIKDSPYEYSSYKNKCSQYNKIDIASIKKIKKEHEATDADVAYTIQKFLEEQILNIIEKDYLDHIQECDNNLILTGGVALNVLVNQKIKEKFKDINVFVSSNPHDGGLSVGMAYKTAIKAGYIPKGKKYNLEDTGLELFDIHRFNKHKNKHRNKIVNVQEISDLLKEGKILGFLQGKMEIGPRALGNRSILCDASYPNMKDIINNKVKFREPFRPFAPMCKKEDASKYFEARDFDFTENMSFTVNVKPEYRGTLKSITHEDNTARLQTVTQESNPTIYELLAKFDGVLLNTSFNVQGQPILNTLKDAAKVLENTSLDGYIVKHKNTFYLFY